MNNRFQVQLNSPCMRIRTDLLHELCAEDLFRNAHESSGSTTPFQAPRYVGFYTSRNSVFLNNGAFACRIERNGLIEDLLDRLALSGAGPTASIEASSNSMGNFQGSMLVYDSRTGFCHHLHAALALAFLSDSRVGG